MKFIFLAFLGSLFPAVLFNIQRKFLFFAGLSGMLGFIVFNSIQSNTGRIVFAAFMGSIAVGLYSETMARILKTPAFVFSITGIFPLVPGIYAYYTVLYLVNRNFNNAVNQGIITIGIAGSIAFGLILSSSMYKFIYSIVKKA